MMSCQRVLTYLRIFGTTMFGVSLLVGISTAYIMGYQFFTTAHNHLSFGLYGAILVVHLIIQSLFALLEHRNMKRSLETPIKLNKSLALCIAAYQEDPNYLRKCLVSVKRLTYPGIKVILVVDGNSDDDLYMMEIFKEIMGWDKVATYVWRSNFHSRGPEETDESYAESVQQIYRLVLNNKCVCIMQKWGGKREVMYTAFKALGRSVDYVQVCDSDTMLDPASSVEMVKVLEEDPMVGGVGGDVQILNKYESWISFLSSVRYWMAFNIERACQSYFGCVQCISGPLGMYRNSLLHEFLEDWYNQTFMGSHCSFGDDRHLTNRVLSLGYATKYTARSKCLTETPITYLRWLNQQTRWSKSYFREWLYNSMWFHKHHLWMTYEAVITGFFPFFLIATAIQLFYQGRLWNILLFLLIVQAVALIKSTFASCLRGNIVMVFMSFYSVLYMSSLLPAKMFAIATINKSGWGTSGRKTIVVNFIGLIPISVWFTILFIGIIYSTILQTRKPFPESEMLILIIGAVVYASYWVILLSLYAVLICKCGKRKKETHYDMVLDV
ncbi:hyaluronan synthase 2 [Dunckerocampus dactyliophorus]|uniref:hyaluronan synthase 2 n=1 Tax=Dunckerocampus dactyliophorus TaxID=161453 RepID=UPI002405DCF2|nr:hyaluronan synthase 2 [Dunckerocampus dactyliophorus]